jgi:hypothetical protein
MFEVLRLESRLQPVPKVAQASRLSLSAPPPEDLSSNWKFDVGCLLAIYRSWMLDVRCWMFSLPSRPRSRPRSGVWRLGLGLPARAIAEFSVRCPGFSRSPPSQFVLVLVLVLDFYRFERLLATQVGARSRFIGVECGFRRAERCEAPILTTNEHGFHKRLTTILPLRLDRGE